MEPTLSPAFARYAVASTILVLQLLLLAFYTGRVRAKNKQWVNPEDAAIFKGPTATEEHPDVVRVKKAHANLLENAMLFFVVGALYASTTNNKGATTAYFGTFVVARLLHSVVYIWGKQPWRTILFGIGALSIIGMAVHVLRFYA